jgi:hypothetical protein
MTVDSDAANASAQGGEQDCDQDHSELMARNEEHMKSKQALRRAGPSPAKPTAPPVHLQTQDLGRVLFEHPTAQRAAGGATEQGPAPAPKRVRPSKLDSQALVSRSVLIPVAAAAGAGETEPSESSSDAEEDEMNARRPKMLKKRANLAPGSNPAPPDTSKRKRQASSVATPIKAENSAKMSRKNEQLVQDHERRSTGEELPTDPGTQPREDEDDDYEDDTFT